MSDSGFVAYRGGEDLHDGRIVSMSRCDDSLLVVVKGFSGRHIEIHFDDVHEIRAHRPEGMLLYALVETECEPPLRKFTFANWDDEDDACLQVVSEHFEARETDEDAPACESG